MQLGLHSPKPETGPSWDPRKHSWFREALPSPAFRFYLYFPVLSISPSKHSFCSFSEGGSISAPASHSVFWLVWFETLHMCWERHIFIFGGLWGFLSLACSCGLVFLFTLKLRSGKGAGCTQAAGALGQSEQEQALLLLPWIGGSWDAGPCTHSFRAPGFKSQEL